MSLQVLGVPFCVARISQNKQLVFSSMLSVFLLLLLDPQSGQLDLLTLEGEPLGLVVQLPGLSYVDPALTLDLGERHPLYF